MKLDKTPESVYRQYYRELQSLKVFVDSEMARYEKGESMSGNLANAAVNAIRYGARVEMLYDFLVEDGE